MDNQVNYLAILVLGFVAVAVPIVLGLVRLIERRHLAYLKKSGRNVGEKAFSGPC